MATALRRKDEEEFVFLDVVPSAPAIHVPYARRVEEDDEEDFNAHHSGRGEDTLMPNDRSVERRTNVYGGEGGDSFQAGELLAHVNEGRPILIVPNHFGEGSRVGEDGAFNEDTAAEHLRKLGLWKGGKKKGSIAYYTLSNSTTTVMVPMVTPVTNWGEAPLDAVCPFCFAQVKTIVKRDAFGSTVPVALGLVAFGLWPVAILPFCATSLHDIRHQCPLCSATLAIIKRSFKDYVKEAKKLGWYCYEGCKKITKKMYGGSGSSQYGQEGCPALEGAFCRDEKPEQHALHLY